MVLLAESSSVRNPAVGERKLTRGRHASRGSFPPRDRRPLSAVLRRIRAKTWAVYTSALFSSAALLPRKTHALAVVVGRPLWVVQGLEEVELDAREVGRLPHQDRAGESSRRNDCSWFARVDRPVEVCCARVDQLPPPPRSSSGKDALWKKTISNVQSRLTICSIDRSSSQVAWRSWKLASPVLPSARSSLSRTYCTRASPSTTKSS